MNIHEHRQGKSLKVVALIVGEPRAPALWVLKKLASAFCVLYVVRAKKARDITLTRHFSLLLHRYGLLKVISRIVGTTLIGRREYYRQLKILDKLLDGNYLREWWKSSGIVPIDVLHLNHIDARSAITALEPDILVRVSGGVLKPEIFTLARCATINIHHGWAPQIRGMQSIEWGIVESRLEWIGATIHAVDRGIDTGPIFWLGRPQIAPGDTGDFLFFRAHLEAVDALVNIINDYAKGITPPVFPDQMPKTITYRSALGLWEWIKYMRVHRGKQALVILERALKNSIS